MIFAHPVSARTYLHVCNGVDFCLTLWSLLKLLHQLLNVAANLAEIHVQILQHKRNDNNETICIFISHQSELQKNTQEVKGLKA